jgi:hypothetical protein
LAKTVLFLCILFCLLAAAAGPKVVSAGVEPLASPTPRPTERITAPVISGVNPDAVLSEGNLGDTHPSGSFIPVGISLPVLVDPPKDSFYILDIETGETTLLSNWEVAVEGFSDDSATIFFQGRPELNSSWALYLINVDGTNLRHLTYFDEFLETWYAGVEEY